MSVGEEIALMAWGVYRTLLAYGLLVLQYRTIVLKYFGGCHAEG